MVIRSERFSIRDDTVFVTFFEIATRLIDRKKARGSCVKPWALIPEFSQTGGVVPLFIAARTFFQGQCSS
jgi:hypothetical protein